MKASRRFQLIVALIILCDLQHLMQSNAKRVSITNIRVNSDHEFVDINCTKHENFQLFDINFTIHKILYENQLFANMRIKRKVNGNSAYRSMFAWKGIEVCGFVKRVSEKQYYKDAFKLTEIIEQLQCPLKIGNYHIKGFEVGKMGFIELATPGQYRIIVESVGKEAQKVFTMIITLRIE